MTLKPERREFFDRFGDNLLSKELKLAPFRMGLAGRVRLIVSRQLRQMDGWQLATKRVQHPGARREMV